MEYNKEQADDYFKAFNKLALEDIEAKERMVAGYIESIRQWDSEGKTGRLVMAFFDESDAKAVKDKAIELGYNANMVSGQYSGVPAFELTIIKSGQ